MGTPRHNMRISAALLVACASVVAAFPAPTQNFTALPGRNAFPGKVTWGYYFLGNQPYQSPKTIIAQGVNYVCISFGNIGSSGTFEFPGGGCAGPDTEYCKGFMKSNLCIPWGCVHCAQFDVLLIGANQLCAYGIGICLSSEENTWSNNVINSKQDYTTSIVYKYTIFIP